MASITSYTKTKMDELLDQTVVGVEISGGQLVMITGDGQRQNVGQVISRAYEAFPINSLYFSESSANPATRLGGGTWQRWGQGRMPVSVDENDVAFNVAGKTGGSKTHVLTTDEMPSHAHGGVTGDDSPDHGHSGATTSDGAHEHNYITRASAVPQGTGNNIATNYTFTTATTTGGGGHGHNVTVGGASVRHQHGISNQGGGQPHNNLPPYMTVYIWKRTA